MSTKKSKVPGAVRRLGEGPWRSRAGLIAAFFGVGVTGVILGRASVSIPPAPPSPPAPSTPGSPSPPAVEAPQAFDLTEVPGLVAGLPVRPMDREIFELITSQRFERSRMHDVFPDKPYKVRFIGSAAQRHVGVVLVDLDRDGIFDERWDLRPDTVKRTVEHDPTARGAAVYYTLSHGRWQPH